MRVVFVSIFYPVFMGGYILHALQKRPDVSLFTVGPYTGDWIPWGGGMQVKHRFSPDLPFPPDVIRLRPPMAMVESRLPWKADLWVQVDAGFHLEGKPSNGLNFIVGTDPHCVSGDTLLATERGLLSAEEMCGLGPSCVASHVGMERSDGVIASGMKPTRTLTLDGGYTLTCTDDHQVETDSGFMIASALRKGDKVHLATGTYVPPSGTPSDFDFGFVIGAFHGDGNFGRPGFVRFCISKTKKLELKERLERALLSAFGIDCVTVSRHHDCENALILQVRRWGLYRLLKAMRAKDPSIPLIIRRGSGRMLAGYFAGLFATDGCSYQGRLQITTMHRRLAHEWQTVLLYLGIPTSVQEFESNASSYRPGNKYATLYIRTGPGADRFHDLTGDIPGRPIRLGTNARGLADGTDQYLPITKIEGVVRNYPHLRCPEPVYDVTSTESGTFLANGISVHNCLNYDHQRTLADKFFCMQKCYAKPGDVYLPYAYDPEYHAPEKVEKAHDACLIGLHYTSRDQLVNELRRRGRSVHYSLGPAYEEARHLYNQSRVGLNWSSLLDLNARAFELLGYGIPAVMNVVPDIGEFFQAGRDYMPFRNLSEAVEGVEWLLGHPNEAADMATFGHKAVAKHTWDARVEEILSYAR